MNVNINIGSSKTNCKDVDIKFPQSFGEVPPEIDDMIIVLASIVLNTKSHPLSSCTDKYGVNVVNITRDGFTARIYRVDAQEGWEMDLSLNYSANQCTHFSNYKPKG